MRYPCSLTLGTLVEATRFLIRQSEGGSADAQFRLGYRLAFKRSTRRYRWQEVAQLWRRAKQRHVRTMFHLAVCYDQGRGVARNLRHAALWYRRAARKGHVESAFNLGMMYRDGSGLRQDSRRAERYFRAAALRGDVEAAREYGRMLVVGHKRAQMIREGVHWYRRAAAAGDALATYNLALCYLDGHGVKGNTRLSTHYLKKARRLRVSAASALLRKIERGRSR